MMIPRKVWSHLWQGELGAATQWNHLKNGEARMLVMLSLMRKQLVEELQEKSEKAQQQAGLVT
jgi:hypothetical protein